LQIINLNYFNSLDNKYRKYNKNNQKINQKGFYINSLLMANQQNSNNNLGQQTNNFQSAQPFQM